ncbi:hypothetical protein BC938DRAFT_472502 [Jimgerdemannia flammicorona]|uniref:F-box domain-containing protein n=1 Tax=Jimgerdemannia flammicorona TaxID=994334 RepID=A0A433Q5Y4_9FUNG|nr:hypothetical protein BC938DRAFT_472502 [Jimgerdemannia flammicorona]
MAPSGPIKIIVRTTPSSLSKKPTCTTLSRPTNKPVGTTPSRASRTMLLPPELILICLKIVINAPETKNIFNLLLLNRAYRLFLLPILYRDLHLAGAHFTAFANPKQDRALHSFFLRHLKITGAIDISLKKLRPMTDKATNIVSITLDSITDASSPQDYEEFFVSPPNPKTIQAITIVRCPLVSRPWVIRGLARFENLRILHIDRYDEDAAAITNLMSDLANHIDGVPRIKALLITSNFLAPATLLTSVSAVAPTLEYLSLARTWVSGKALRAMATKLVSLRALDLGGCKKGFETADVVDFVISNAAVNVNAVGGQLKIHVGGCERVCEKELAEKLKGMGKVVGEGFEGEDVMRWLGMQ